jgi:hypothetical protein
MATAFGCGKQDPRGAELLALESTATVMQASNEHLGRVCSNNLIVNNQDLATSCNILSDRNAAAQQAIIVGLNSYKAAVAGGNKADVDKALASLQAAVCYMTILFPDMSTDVESLRTCGGLTR